VVDIAASVFQVAYSLIEPVATPFHGFTIPKKWRSLPPPQSIPEVP
jgi:hypothetical protein